MSTFAAAAFVQISARPGFHRGFRVPASDRVPPQILWISISNYRLLLYTTTRTGYSVVRPRRGHLPSDTWPSPSMKPAKYSGETITEAKHRGLVRMPEG